VDLSLLINTHSFDFERVATSATWIRELEKPADHFEHEHEHEHHHEHGEDCHCHECSCGHHHHHHHGEGEAEEYGIGTFVYFNRRPFDLNKFDWYAGSKWSKEIIRCKGVCYFKENPRMSYLFETAGKQKKLTEAGLWYAEAPKDELEQMLLTDPGIMRDWDEKYGDRMQKLVIIGRNLDRKAITAALDSCLADE
ncbi:MAG: GTP-binding protein, partial [Muribaculaceae bacterium]|nr:GTP-binding protein [Muribaculaceae bacterium]